MSATPPRHATPGAVLCGKYRVDRVLGEGGMGVVVAATDQRLDRKVAIKTLKDSGAAPAEARARFAREGRAAAVLSSEHVVRVLDVDATDDGTPLLVMEYVRGKNLAAELEAAGPLTPERAIDLVLQAAEGVAAAHRAGIVHRDLKPSNLMLTRGTDGAELVKVADFGISKSLRDAGPSLTGTGGGLGSPLYMAPEQLLSSDVDARADVWALGVVLFQLVSGRLPFEGDTASEVAARIAAEPPRDLASVLAGAPPALSAAIAGALKKDRSERFPTLADFAAALAPLGGATAAARALRVRAILDGSDEEVTEPRAFLDEDGRVTKDATPVAMTPPAPRETAAPSHPPSPGTSRETAAPMRSPRATQAPKGGARAAVAPSPQPTGAAAGGQGETRSPLSRVAPAALALFVLVAGVVAWRATRAPELAARSEPSTPLASASTTTPATASVDAAPAPAAPAMSGAPPPLAPPAPSGQAPASAVRGGLRPPRGDAKPRASRDPLELELK